MAPPTKIYWPSMDNKQDNVLLQYLFGSMTNDTKSKYDGSCVNQMFDGRIIRSLVCCPFHSSARNFLELKYSSTPVVYIPVLDNGISGRPPKRHFFRTYREYVTNKIEKNLKRIKTWVNSPGGQRVFSSVAYATFHGFVIFVASITFLKIHSILNESVFGTDIIDSSNFVPSPAIIPEPIAKPKEPLRLNPYFEQVWLKVQALSNYMAYVWEELLSISCGETAKMLMVTMVSGFTALNDKIRNSFFNNWIIYNEAKPVNKDDTIIIHDQALIDFLNIVSWLLNATITALSIVSFVAILSVLYEMYLGKNQPASGGQLNKKKSPRTIREWAIELLWGSEREIEKKDKFDLSKSCAFDCVFGHENTKLELLQIADLLTRPGYYAARGVRCPRGILLEGPSGSGKTLLAKALASKIDVPFLHFTASSFVEMYVGRGAQRVRQAFSEARKLAPCVMFIDEIDALGVSRGSCGSSGFGGGGHEYIQTVNQLLVEIDGITDSAQAFIKEYTHKKNDFEKTNESSIMDHENYYSSLVVVVAATNRLQLVDNALRRPGRFDKVIHIPPPTPDERLDILKFYTSSKMMAPNVNLKRIAHELMQSPEGSGWTGADIESMVNEAALESLRECQGILSEANLVNVCEVFNVRKKEEKKVENSSPLEILNSNIIESFLFPGQQYPAK